MTRRSTRIALVAALALSAGCSRDEDALPERFAKMPIPEKPKMKEEKKEEMAKKSPARHEKAAMAVQSKSGLKMLAAESAPGSSIADALNGATGVSGVAGGIGAVGAKGGGAGKALSIGDLSTDSESEPESAPSKPAPTRSWFPESFLFEPLVVTDGHGQAAVNVPVPDRLTTWRVLALAHSEEGSQAGAVASFLGTLPAYVDPVVPASLLVGDEVRIPIQVVNTTDQPISMPLQLSAENGSLDGAGGQVKVAGGDTEIRFTTLKATGAGEATLKATYGSTDAVVRTIPVKPSGQPYLEQRGGTLAAPRTLELTGPADLEPGTSHVRLLVYPGALSLVRSELAGASSREGADADAYALLLSGRAPQLLAALGEKANPDALRSLALVAGQRVIRASQSPSVSTAALFAEAAAAHPENPVLERLGMRLSEQVARAQRPDGTFEGESGWTLQRLLVVTGDCARVVASDRHDRLAQQRAATVGLRASGAFERNLERIQDGYTAAVVLGSGVVEGSVADALRAKVREAITQNSDGSRSLRVPAGVVRPDGQVPTEVEATARAALALADDPLAPWRADLGASLLGSYGAEVGWGDGATNRVALQAVAQLFKEPLPKAIKVVLEVDGKPSAEGELSGERLHDVLALEAPVASAAGSHTFAVRAEPPVPGLGFALSLQGYTPWKAESGTGLELQIAPPSELRVGQPARIDLSAAAPSGQPLHLREALPAGVQPDTASLDALVSADTIRSYHLEAGAVEMALPPLPSGQAFAASYRVVPTLAGTLQAGASTLALEARPAEAYHLPPSTWTILVPSKGAKEFAPDVNNPVSLEPSAAEEDSPAPGPKPSRALRTRVVDAQPDIEGDGIDRDSLARFVKVRLKSIQACYERQLKRNPGLRGKIVVRFTIAESGRVKDVNVDHDTLGSDEVANCIKTTIRAWTTPFHPGGEVPVSYPFIFSTW